MAALFSLLLLSDSVMIFSLTAVKVKEWEGKPEFWAGLASTCGKPKVKYIHFPSP